MKAPVAVAETESETMASSNEEAKVRFQPYLKITVA
jgi:hypothetical protein